MSKPCESHRDDLLGWCVLPFQGVDYCAGEYRETGKPPKDSVWQPCRQM